jgi:hypothetical protein
MAAGHKAKDWPRKCFDGEKHWQLGWFFRRQRSLLSNDLAAGRLINLATFVDYDKSDYDEPVLIRIHDVFLQYNRAKAFNVDTEEKKDQVTITRRTGSGSNALAGLSEGDRYSEYFFDQSKRTILIEACGKISGSRGADVMVISVAIGRSLCNEFYTNQKTISLASSVVNNHLTRAETDRQPALLFPTRPPIVSPSTGPSQHPSISPTSFPSVDLSVSPSSAPTPPPTRWTPESLEMVSQFWSVLAAWRDQNSPRPKHDNQQSPLSIGTTRGPAKVNVVNTSDVVNDNGGSAAPQTTPSMSSVLADEGFKDDNRGKQNPSRVQSVFSSRGEDGV